MVYCLNPSCQTPNNHEDADVCLSCGSNLTLGQFQQRILKPLNPPRRKRLSQTKRLFLVRDRQDRMGVMEVFDDGIASMATLFQRTATLLRQIQDPGVPQYFEQFIIVTPTGKRLNCLVREHLPGVDLQTHLDKMGAIDPSTAQRWLTKIGHTLDVIHQQGFLHLDLKPANIILGPQERLTLIDFSEGSESLSAGYSPIEQANGTPSTASDFYALGRTLVHLLTGQHPLDLTKEEETGRLQWEDKCEDLPSALADIINAMMHKEVDRRLQSSVKIAASLQPPLSIPATTPHPEHFVVPNTLLLSTAGLGILFGFGVALIVPAKLNPLQNAIAQFVDPQNHVACHPQQGASFSCGERSLIPGNQGLESYKKEGLEAFSVHDYQKALTALAEARKENPLDPELVIFENNAQIKLLKEPNYTIVIAAPLKIQSLAQYILRGVAQLQTEVNQSDSKINGRSLQIMIADDGNSPSTATDLAHQIVKKENIIGVVGHYASELSIASLETYQEAQIPVISYGSTSLELSCNNVLACPHNIFFRTVPTTTDEAQNLANYAFQSQEYQKVGVVYNQQSPFSRSLKSEFEQSINALGGEVVEILPACTQGKLNEAQLRERLAELQVTAVALFPDGQVCDTSSSNSIALANSTQGKYPILNSWTFDSPEIYNQLSDDVFERTVTGAPWHYTNHQNEFQQGAQSLWGEQNLSEILTGLSATSYDATKVLIEALRQLNGDHESPRQAILQTLRQDSSFKVMGATGEIQFLGSDRRHSQMVLLRPKINPCAPKNPIRELVPIHEEYRDEPLNCTS